MKLGTREKVLLGAAAALLLYQGSRVLIDRLDTGSLPLSLSRGSQARRAAEAVEVTQVSELDLGLLEPSSGMTTIGRDPFRYAPKRTSAPASPRRKQPPPAPKPAPAARPPAKPPIGVRYLGSFGSRDVVLAVFTDGETIHNAMVGDTVMGRLVVERIGYESVDVRFVERPELPPERLAIAGRRK